MKSILNKYSLYLILILATVLRILNIAKRDFWFDEAFTGSALKANIPDMMGMIIKDVHPPLYFYLAKVYSSFFNYSVFGIRSFSAIMGILGIWAIYLFAKELFNKKVALWASFLMAISPFAVEYSKEARMYSMLGFLIVLASYFFIKGLKTNRLIYYFWWGIILGLAALTHYMAIFFAPIFYFVYLVWNFDTNNKRNISSIIKQLLPVNVIIGYIISIIVFIPWLHTFLGQLKAGQNLSWIQPVGLGDFFTDIQIFLFGNPEGEMSSGMPLPNQLHGITSVTMLTFIAVFTCFVLFFLFKKSDNKKKAIIICLLSLGSMAIIYFLNLAGKYYFVSRYIIASSYFLFILFAVWLSNIKPKFAYVAIIIYIIMLVDVINVPTSRGYNELYQDLNKYKGDNIYFLNTFDYVVGKYYFGADKITLYNIDWPQYNPEDWSSVGSSLRRTEDFNVLKNDPRGIIVHDTQWPLAWRSDKTFNPDNYQLIARYHNISVYKSNSFKN